MQPMKPMKPMEPMTFGETPRWWPDDLGEPSAAGSQNDVQYAYFRDAKRLLLREQGTIVAYGTADHHIHGVAQASDATHAQFTSDHGVVNLGDLERL